MPTNIVMPQMGESIFEGTITKWLKKEGEPVKRDEPLFEISTDKIDTEIQSSVAGVLQKIVMPEGSKVPIHTVVATIDEGAGGAAPSSAPPKAAAPAPAPKPASAPAPVPAAPVPVDGGEQQRVFASPLVRRIARQEGVDLKQLEGSGWKGRITKKDIEDHLGRGGPAPTPAPVAAPTPAPMPTVRQAPAPAPAPAAAPRPAAVAGRTQVVPMTNMRAKIAEHMVKSKATSAHVTTCHQIDVTKIS